MTGHSGDEDEHGSYWCDGYWHEDYHDDDDDIQDCQSYLNSLVDGVAQCIKRCWGWTKEF